MAPRAKRRICRRYRPKQTNIVLKWTSGSSRWDIFGTSIPPNKVDPHNENSGKIRVFFGKFFQKRNNLLTFRLAQEAILQRLCTLHSHQGVGPAGVRDILAAHCKSIEGSVGADVATAEMEGLTICALKSLPDACFS